MPLHYFIAEAWPDPMPAGSWPIQLPEHLAVTAADPDAALAEARRQAGPGRFVIVTGHARYKCQPPHGRQNQRR